MTSGFPSFPTPLPPARRTRGGWVILALVVLVLSGALLAWWQSAGPDPEEKVTQGVSLADSTARAPAGQRVRVRVLNTTTTRGLARRATFLLRDFGYDVVDFDSDTKARRTSTLVVVHTGAQEIGDRVIRVLGTGTVEARPDTLRYVDLTVFLGSDWKPPSEPLRP